MQNIFGKFGIKKQKIEREICDQKSIDRGEEGEEKEKERKKKESVYIEIFTIFNKNGLGEQENRF